MGRDIHLHIEVKVNGKWEHYAAPYIERNHALFDLMDQPNSNSKDAIKSCNSKLLSDLSLITKLSMDYWKPDVNLLWYDFESIKELSSKLNTLYKKLYVLEDDILHTWLGGNCFKNLKEYKKDHNKWIEDVRFIFWFDN